MLNCFVETQKWIWFFISRQFKVHIFSIFPRDNNPFILHQQFHGCWWPGPWFNIKMSSYQYRKFHCGDKTVVRSSYLHNEISYTGKMTSFYWIRPLVMQGVRSLAAIITTSFPHNIPASVPEVLIFLPLPEEFRCSSVSFCVNSFMFLSVIMFIYGQVQVPFPLALHENLVVTSRGQ